MALNYFFPSTCNLKITYASTGVLEWQIFANSAEACGICLNHVKKIGRSLTLHISFFFLFIWSNPLHVPIHIGIGSRRCCTCCILLARPRSGLSYPAAGGFPSSPPLGLSASSLHHCEQQEVLCCTPLRAYFFLMRLYPVEKSRAIPTEPLSPPERPSQIGKDAEASEPSQDRASRWGKRGLCPSPSWPEKDQELFICLCEVNRVESESIF